MEKLLSVLIATTLLLLLLSSTRMWAAALERLRRGGSIIPFETRRPVPWGLIDLLLVVLIMFFALQGTHQIAASRWNVPLDQPMEKLEPWQLATLIMASSVATLVSCLASILVVWLRAGATWRDLGLVVSQFWSDAKLGAGAFVMLAPPMYLLQFGLTQIWPYEHPVQDLLEQQTDVSMLLVTLFTAVGVAPLAEEMFFRVLLQGWMENASVLARKALGLIFALREVASDELQRDWRAVMIGDRHATALVDWPSDFTAPSDIPVEVPAATAAPRLDADNPYAPPLSDLSEPPANASSSESASPERFHPGHVPLVLSAAIFALLHVGQGPAPIPLFFLAIGLGYLYRQTHRVAPSFIVHLMINSLSMAVMWAGLVLESS